MVRILQISPDIGPGTGVGAVAHHLGAEWARLGHEVSAFTLRDAKGQWLPEPGAGLVGRLGLLSRVVWFSTVGTIVVRRRLRADPGLVSICHNDALAGDIYVNHGIVQAAMRARGNYWWRMARNPLHLFTSVRDRWRYGGHADHQLVINLVAAEEPLLRATYPRMTIPTVVVGNGVDIERFRPPTPEQRAAARAGAGLAAQDQMVLFVGHEFDRKGLPVALAAMADLPERVRLFVVGGTDEQIAAVRATTSARRLGRRLELVGADPNPMGWFQAADVFVLPSAYESYGLVVLEALACGLPVVATATGCVPDVVQDGVNGVIVGPRGSEVAAGVQFVLDKEPGSMAQSARNTATEHAWPAVAATYLDVMASHLAPRRGRT